MRICIVAEGCYPYVVGGVSSWIHSMIKIFPEYQFVVLAIVANRSLRGKFVYDLPENVVEVHELYLEDADWRPKELKRAARLKLNEREYAALRSLLMNQNVDWDTLFSFFGEKEFSLNELLMGEDFFRAVQECYTVRYAGAVFSDFLWTMRSMYLPLFLTLGMRLPLADTGQNGKIQSAEIFRHIHPSGKHHIRQFHQIHQIKTFSRVFLVFVRRSHNP